MKKILSQLFSIFLFIQSGNTQNPDFNFTILSNTKMEGSGFTTVGYIKASQPITSNTTIDLTIQSGVEDSLLINNFIDKTITFTVGTDSLPFAINITDDTLIIGTQSVVFALRNNSSNSNIGIDSLFTLFITDNDTPATIQWTVLLDTVSEHYGNYPMAIKINNPNNFFTRYYSQTDIPLSTCDGGWDYSFDWNYHYAPPGISYDTVFIRITNDLILEPTEYIIFKIRDYGNNIATDSMAKIVVVDDDYFFPPSISFDFPVDSNWEDSFGTIAVPLTIINFNYNNVDYNVVPDFTKSSATTGADFNLPNTFFSHGEGTYHDTAQLKIIHDFKVENTESIFLRIAYKNTHISADSNYIFYIKDRDSVKIGFIGAGYTHVESEGVCLVPIVSTSSINYPISIEVKYLNGNATSGIDFIFSDTTILFPANSSDTQYVKVTLLEDKFDEGNEQVNLYITNPSPNFTRTGVLQYTFTIIDNDTAFTSLKNTTTEGLSVYPNPAKSKLIIQSEESMEELFVYNTLGEKLYFESNIGAGKHTIDIENLPTGLYFLVMEKKGIFITKKIMKE